MKKTILTLAFTIASVVCFGQKDKFFHSEEEAKAVHPDSVYKVYLENYKGTSLPEWLFNHKNLKYLDLRGSTGNPSPLNNVNGISKFANLKFLDIAFTNFTAIPDELAKMDITISLPGAKITSVRSIFEAMVTTKGESYIYFLENFNTMFIANKEELKWFNKLSGNRGHNWIKLEEEGKPVKFTLYYFDYYRVKKQLPKLEEYLNSTK